jgi:hypothetical protein
VWVNVTPYGFVGVGIVTGGVQPFAGLNLTTKDGRIVSAYDLPLRGSYRFQFKDDPERCEYGVPVRWLSAVPVQRGFREAGFFGNQNTVCRPKTKKWKITLSRLKERFKVE